jgi:hypothetical protein
MSFLERLVTSREVLMRRSRRSFYRTKEEYVCIPSASSNACLQRLYAYSRVRRSRFGSHRKLKRTVEIWTRQTKALRPACLTLRLLPSCTANRAARKDGVSRLARMTLDGMSQNLSDAHGSGDAAAIQIFSSSAGRGC